MPLYFVVSPDFEAQSGSLLIRNLCCIVILLTNFQFRDSCMIAATNLNLGILSIASWCWFRSLLNRGITTEENIQTVGTETPVFMSLLGFKNDLGVDIVRPRNSVENIISSEHFHNENPDAVGFVGCVRGLKENMSEDNAQTHSCEFDKEIHELSSLSFSSIPDAIATPSRLKFDSGTGRITIDASSFDQVDTPFTER